MKTALFLLMLLALGIPAVPAAPWMSESAAEFFASADFDGDGRPDSMIIDKAAGVIRIGYQTASGTWTWAPARPAGAVPVMAAAAGRFLDPGLDGIAVTSPSANRVLIHPAGNVNTAGIPVALSGLVGPDTLAPLPLPGFGVGEQLLAGSAQDPASSPYVLAGFDPGAGLLSTQPQDMLLRQGQPIQLKTGGAAGAAFLAGGAGGSELRVYSGILAAPPMLIAPGVADGAHYVAAPFEAGSDLIQVLCWTPGTPELQVRRILEPAAGTFAPDAVITHLLSGNISQIVVLDDPDGPRLLVLLDDGASAGIYTFDGSNAPVLLESFTPLAEERFRAATLAGGGSFVLSSSPASTARSQTFRPYRRDSPTGYTPLASAALPGVTANAGRANVLLFAGPPFVDESARPLAALQAGDWTRLISFGAGGVLAEAELFGGTAAGLELPASYLLGPAPAGADEALANQFESYLSISSLRPAYDSPELEPAIAPTPGSFEAAQSLTFSAPAGVSIFYRLDAGSWQLWGGGPQWLTAATTVSYYGSDGLRNSALRTAVYTFPGAGTFLDSDHDGVPDFVELASGIPDPTSGHDNDGDGADDDAELLAGTDPNNRASVPPALTPRPGDTGITLTATLRSWRAGGPDPAFTPQPGTRVDAITTTGTLLATRIVPGAIPAGDRVVMENLAVPRGTSFISLTTAPSWNREEGGTVSYASQSIALVPAPPPPLPPDIAYVPGGGPPAVEAAAWIAALAAAEAAQTPRHITATLSPVDSLVALIIEKKLDDILVGRGADPATRLSLFDTGLTDAGARRVSAAQFAALELPGPADEPAWQMGQLYEVIHNAVQDLPGDAGVPALRLLAADLFEKFDSVWQPPSAANPDGHSAVYPAPLDVLRTLIRGGVLPQGYLDVTALAAADLAAAQTALSSILALPAPRPEVTLILTALADSWRPDCTVLNNGGAPLALVGRDGKPWRLQASLALPAGSLVMVRGFTDRPPPPPACADATLEVISLTVQTLPGGIVSDADGDGLGDDWELVFFGNLNQNGSGDFDGDGVTNAAELAAGSDPAGRPAGGAVPLVLPIAGPLPLPEPVIAVSPKGMIDITWACSEECRRTLIYSLESNPGLIAGWERLPALPQFLPDGRMRFLLPPEGQGRSFYRIRVTQP
jgi:hypothetical protein